MRNFILLMLSWLMITGLSAQAGTWKTIDDETGQAKSHVEITIDSKGILTGKIIKLLQKPETTLCDQCKGDLYNKPILGMQILQNMRLKDGYYQGGTIFDPNSGKTYKCKLWLQANDNNVLEVRGSIGPFYRTQKWYRV